MLIYWTLRKMTMKVEYEVVNDYSSDECDIVHRLFKVNITLWPQLLLSWCLCDKSRLVASWSSVWLQCSLVKSITWLSQNIILLKSHLFLLIWRWGTTATQRLIVSLFLVLIRVLSSFFTCNQFSVFPAGIPECGFNQVSYFIYWFEWHLYVSCHGLCILGSLCFLKIC